jgi:hypothetical protein
MLFSLPAGDRKLKQGAIPSLDRFQLKPSGKRPFKEKVMKTREESGATSDQIDSDIRQTVIYALNQITEFLKRVNEKAVGMEKYHEIDRIIYARVIHDPFPFHALPDLADRINEISLSEITNWNDFNERIVFIPMSIRELETAIGLELKSKISLEQQFMTYADYRSYISTRFTVVGGMIQFPRHLEEYLQEEFNESGRIKNPLIQNTWDEISDFVTEHMYDEICSAYEEEMKMKWIKENAYFRWVHDEYRHGQHERHWREAVEEYEALEQELCEAPLAVNHLACYTRSE